MERVQGQLHGLTARPHPLVAEGVVKRFGPARAVDGLDLVVEAGTVAALAGPNGSGKTTTLALVAGLLPLDAGRIALDGAPAGTAAARRSAAFVPDEPRGFDELAVGELLGLVRALYGAGSDFDARAARLLEAFGLAPRAGARLGELSHGLRRQASVVAAAALAPRLLVVDEATAALDPEAVVVLRETVRALAHRGSAVLVATQDLRFAEDVADRVHLLDRGRVVAEGPLPGLLGRFCASSLEEAFLAAVGRPGLGRTLRSALDAL